MLYKTLVFNPPVDQPSNLPKIRSIWTLFHFTGVKDVELLLFGDDAVGTLLFKLYWEGSTACFRNESFKQLCHES